MGFWEAVGAAAKGVANCVQEEQEKYQEYLEKYEYSSDEELLRIARNNVSSANPRRLAALKILSDRGYTQI